jgi:hypothetical protein
MIGWKHTLDDVKKEATMNDDVESTATELEPVQVGPPTTLFRTDDPAEVIERASSLADVLKGVLTTQNLTQNIQGKEYVKVEGWTTLGSMLGIVPVCVWTREVEKGRGGWEARVEARTLDGRTIGAADAQCLRAEKEWGPNPTRGKPREDYALRSMAQTRATSKALRAPLGWIVTLAGYEATPSEEIPLSGPEDAPQAVSQPTADVSLDDRPLSDPERRALDRMFAEYEGAGCEFDRLAMRAVADGGELDTGGSNIWAGLTRAQGRSLYQWMTGEIAERAGGHVK